MELHLRNLANLKVLTRMCSPVGCHFMGCCASALHAATQSLAASLGKAANPWKAPANQRQQY